MGIKWIWEISFTGIPTAIDQLFTCIQAEYDYWEFIERDGTKEKITVCFRIEGKETEEDIKRMLEKLLHLFAVEAKVEGYMDDREPDASFTVKGGEL